MQAMVFREVGRPLVLEERLLPLPGSGEIRVRIEACAVCRTDLHIFDGDLPNPKLPLIPGHEIVGIVEAVGWNVDPARIGGLVGVPWLGHTCGCCDFCRGHMENLCDRPEFTGYLAKLQERPALQRAFIKNQTWYAELHPEQKAS